MELVGQETLDSLMQMLPLLVPVILLQMGLMLFCLVDVLRRERTNGPKWLWMVIIVFVNLLGPIAYLLMGREE